MRFETTPPPAPSWDKHLEPEVSAQLATASDQAERDAQWYGPEYAKRLKMLPVSESVGNSFPFVAGCEQTKRELDKYALERCVASWPNWAPVVRIDPDPENDGLEVVA